MHDGTGRRSRYYEIEEGSDENMQIPLNILLCFERSAGLYGNVYRAYIHNDGAGKFFPNNYFYLIYIPSCSEEKTNQDLKFTLGRKNSFGAAGSYLNFRNKI